MFFLIHYSRTKAEIVSMQKYADDQLDHANADRIALEISLNRSGESAEVVVLEAASVERLAATHGRYFKGVRQLAGERQDEPAKS
jgi:hypothetical protein